MKKITENKLEKYKEYLISEEKSKNTIEKYMRDVSAFYMWAKCKTVDKNTVLEYKEYLKSKMCLRSVNSVLSSLNSFFEFCGDFEMKVKMIKIQKTVFANEEKELTAKDYDKLLTTAKNNGDERLYLLMQTLCSIGIRVSELKFITVESLKCGRADIVMKGKVRIIIIPDKICSKLLKYAKEKGINKGSVFISKNGKPLDRSNIWKMLKGLCKQAGVKKEKVFPHNFRHLFAKSFYALHKDIVHLSDILGHSNVNTTRIYTMENINIHRKQIQAVSLFLHKNEITT